MKKNIYLLSITFFAFFLSGCGVTTSQITKGEYYPKLYTKQPKSILVLPAKNTTTSVDATNHFRYTITQPLAEKGYYVFPVHLVDAFFKSENISDTEIIRNIPAKKLQEIFGADAILYVDINAWDTGYAVVSSNVDVGLSFSLVDANSGEEIWQNNAYAYSYEGLDGSNGLAGLIVSAITTAINTGTDYTKLAYVANLYGTALLPVGEYHKQYKKDFDSPIAFMDNAVLEDNRLYVNEYFVFGNKQEGKVALTVRGHAKGYHAFSVNSLNFFNHNGYSNYYITEEIEGRKFLRNRFFKYENNRPYLLANSKKVFVFVESDGTIPYSEENGKYYFQVEHIVELKKLDNKS
jgi:hypothetical protein